MAGRGARKEQLEAVRERVPEPSRWPAPMAARRSTPSIVCYVTWSGG